MITRSPYRSPEFLSTVNYIPFDQASDLERERWDHAQARFRFGVTLANMEEREKSIKTCRLILGVLAVGVCSWAFAIWWLCL